MAELIAAVVLALLAVLVIVVIAGLVLRRRRNLWSQGSGWHARALDTCAAADALHDRVETRLTLAQFDGEAEPAPADRWAETERSMEELATKLQALRSGAPNYNYTTDQATEELIMALAALRSALRADDGDQATSSVLPGEPVSTAEARLMELDAAVRALRAAL